MEHTELAPVQTVSMSPLSGPHCIESSAHMLQVYNWKGHTRSRNAMAQKAPTATSTLIQRKPEPLPDPLGRPLPESKPLVGDTGGEGHLPCSRPSSVTSGRTGRLTSGCEVVEWNSEPRTTYSKNHPLRNIILPTNLRTYTILNQSATCNKYTLEVKCSGPTQLVLGTGLSTLSTMLV